MTSLLGLAAPVRPMPALSSDPRDIFDHLNTGEYIDEDASLISGGVSPRSASPCTVDEEGFSASSTIPHHEWSPPPGTSRSLPDFADPNTGSSTGPGVPPPKNLLDILKALHDTGIQHVMDLPQIVVVGSQSVGKSSLIESMSGITLPRDTNTCTRCPMECRLQYAPTWSCDIVLRFHTGTDGALLREMKEFTFGPRLTDRAMVEKMLRRAQRAILRPAIEPLKFLDDSDLSIEYPPPLSFSTNCVCLRVAGPNLADLYFYDLPGIIANVREGGQESDIKLVSQLAHDYISRPSCIVLLAISCETDFENQGGGRMVLRDAQLKERTIGVLTKPDRCEAGNEHRWTSILKGEESPLKNGWYSVKQPDSVQLKAGITWEEAREKEKAYFDGTEPWAGIRGSARGRLGSPALTSHLSGLLSELVMRRLPFIREEVATRLRDVEETLLTIPANHFEDPCSEVLSRVMKFTMDVSAHIKGIAEFGPQAGLMEALLVVYEAFRDNIEKTAPRCRPWIRGRSRTDEGRLEQLAQQGDHAHGEGRILYLDEALRRTHRARTRELPGNYPFAVKESLIRDFWTEWRAFVLRCFAKVQDILDAHVTKLVEKHFGAYVHGGLLQAVKRVVQTELQAKSRTGTTKLESIFQVESLPFTQNEEYFFSCKDKLITRYRSIHGLSKGEGSLSARLQGHAPAPPPISPVSSRGYDVEAVDPFDQHVSRALSSLAALGFQGLTKSELLRLLPPGKEDPALDIMAEVRAYWQVAYRRFSDLVPLEIDQAYIRAFDSAIHVALVDGLGLTRDGARENCRKWLEEDPAVVAKREELMARKRMLEAALASLACIDLPGGS